MPGELLALRIDMFGGARASLEDVFAAHCARMKSVAFNMLASEADAEDAVQEAFLKAHRSLASFRGGAALHTWIYRALINTCLDEGRRRARRPAAEFVETGTDARQDLRVELRRAIGTLDGRSRAVFLLSAVEGFSHAEIAAMLEITETNSRTLLLEARRRLQELL
ncbi:MAG: RNA polymerase sigma factor [Acidobacteria bacterium]|nr:RNA polymerase sigma factor [Acidobacteriota bacterium]